MLPNDGLEFDYEVINEPTLTFKVDFDNGRIIGETNGLDAIKQSIILILSINRYDYVIYSWNYGSEINELIGEREELVIPESKRLIKEALLQDDRITKVSDFNVVFRNGILDISFKVYSIYGIINMEGVEMDVRG